MRAVVQRTLKSQVSIQGNIEAEIKQGLTVLLGVKKQDDLKDAEYVMDKIINLRIFSDANGKMNLSLKDVNGELLLVSQFTLYGDVKKGRRPAFTAAEDPDKALEIFDFCVEYAKKQKIKVEQGVFGADMQIALVNDGPVTIILDSEKTI